MTQQRGIWDTPSRDIWGGRQTSVRPLVATLGLALLLHLPMLPTALGYWIRVMFREPAAHDDGPQQPLTLPIDIDLLSDPAPDATGEPIAAPAPPPDSLIGEQGAEPAPGDDDFGVDEMAKMLQDDEAKVPEEIEPPAEPQAPEPPEAPAEPEAPPPPPPPAPPPLPAGDLKDTFAMAGDEQAVRALDPNVNVLIASDVLRQRELSASFTELLGSVPQWQGLIGGTAIDPLRDFDRILISGPQFTNPAWIVVAIRYADTRSALWIKKQIDIVVKRSGKEGKWLDRKLPTAVIGKEGERFAVIVPKKRMLWILPKSQEADLARLEGADPFAKMPAAGIVVDLKLPAKPMKNNGIPFPDTIEHLRLHFALNPTEGYTLAVEAWDASAADAQLNAALVKSAIDGLELDLGSVGKLFGAEKISAVGETTFTVKGNRIVASADLSERQMARIMRWIKKGIADREQDKKERAERAATRREEAKKKAADARKKLAAARRMIDKSARAAASASVAPERRDTPPPTDAVPPTAAPELR